MSRIRIIELSEKDFFQIDLDTRSVTRVGDMEENLGELTHYEGKILECIMSRPGQTISYEQILRFVWGRDNDYQPTDKEHSIQVNVNKIKKRFSEYGNDLIKNIRSVGYIFTKPVREINDDDSGRIPYTAASSNQGFNDNLHTIRDHFTLTETKPHLEINDMVKLSKDVLKYNLNSDVSLRTVLDLLTFFMPNSVPNKIAIVLLTATVARYYRIGKNNQKIYEYAMDALKKMDSGYLTGYESWKTAEIMNHVAYTLLSIKKDNDEGDKNTVVPGPEECLLIAEEYIRKALSIIEAEGHVSIDYNARIVLAQIHGNLGAIYQQKYKIKIPNGDYSYLESARKEHKEGYKIRWSISKDGIPDWYYHLARSYTCLASDHYYMGLHYYNKGEYDESEINYREAQKFYEDAIIEAIENKEAVETSSRKGIPEHEKAVCYIRYIGVLVAIMQVNEKMTKKEPVPVSQKMLELFNKLFIFGESGEIQERKAFLLKNGEEQKELRIKADIIISLLNTKGKITPGNRSGNEKEIEAEKELIQICEKVSSNAMLDFSVND